MFNNIGNKIKKLAIIVATCGVVFSILFSIISIINMPDKWFYGLLIMIVGCLVSWIGSFFTYGFGELVENSSIIAKKNEKKQTKNKDIVNKNIITNNIQAYDSINNIDDVTNYDDNIPREDECPYCFHKIKKSDTECNYCGNQLPHNN